MKFEVEQATEILLRTPKTLSTMFEGLSPAWSAGYEDLNNWSVYDVIGHLIHGEETDWMPRAEIILAQGESLEFDEFDRTAMFGETDKATFAEQLDKFATLRRANVEKLLSWRLTEGQLALKGIHPEFGEVTLEQLISTWVVHDLGHIRQIVTWMASKYETNVGPWKAYLSILKK